MSIYRFAQDSPVATIAFHYADGMPMVALIEAPKTATAEQIAATGKALSEQGMSLTPVVVDDRDMLQVSGFLNEQTVVDALAAQQMIKGAPEITKEASDNAPPKSKTKTFLENYSLRIAGVLNLIGDIAMHCGGYLEITAKAHKKTHVPFTPEERKASVTAGTYDLIGGGLYTLGGLNSAAFGNSKSRAASLADRTTNFIAHTENPEAVALEQPKEEKNFLRRHAADVTLGAYTVGAGVLLKKGAWKYQAMTEKLHSASNIETKNEIKGDRREAGWLMSYGISSLIFKLLSLFIKEKPKSEEEKPKSREPIIRAKDWLVEKPLRIFGLGSLVTDSFYAAHTYADYKKGRGIPKFKIITSIAYFMSDYMSAISSKNLLVKPLDADGERGVIALAAQAIAAAPQEKRNALVNQTVQFLSSQAEMQTGKKSIAASLKNHIKHLGGNPWAKRVETPDLILEKQR